MIFNRFGVEKTCSNQLVLDLINLFKINVSISFRNILFYITPVVDVA
jgi:hypothetical protein